MTSGLTFDDDTMTSLWKKTKHEKGRTSWHNREGTLKVNVYPMKDGSGYNFDALNLILMGIEDGEPYHPLKHSATFKTESQAIQYAENWMKEHPHYKPSLQELISEIQSKPRVLGKANP